MSLLDFLFARRHRPVFGRAWMIATIVQKHPARPLRFYFELGRFAWQKYSIWLGYWSVGGFLIHFHDRLLYEWMIDEVFHRQIYRTLLQKKRLNIVDMGANIGTTSLFYARNYPDARIVSYEPDPTALSLLRENIAVNGVKNVRVVEAAIVSSRTRKKTIPFYSAASSVLSTAVPEEAELLPSATRYEVKTCRFADAIGVFAHVDVLKMDIEGGEYALIGDLLAASEKIGSFVIEFHRVDRPLFYQSLSRLSAKYALSLTTSDDGVAEQMPWHSAPHTPQNLMVYGVRRESE